jgi:hypothetical protein
MPTKANLYKHDSIFDAFHKIREDANLPNSNTISNFEWFRRLVNRSMDGGKTLDEIRQQIISDPKRVRDNRFFRGKLYFFFYNEPLYRDKLPFYDTFPLLLLLHRKGSNIFGCNLHYLPPRIRLSKFLELMQYTNQNKLSWRTNIVLDYDKLINSDTWDILRPTFRQYRLNRIQGNCINIPAQDWPIAINLPVERFKKMDRRTIWNRTIKEGLL